MSEPKKRICSLSRTALSAGLLLVGGFAYHGEALSWLEPRILRTPEGNGQFFAFRTLNKGFYLQGADSGIGLQATNDSIYTSRTFEFLIHDINGSTLESGDQVYLRHHFERYLTVNASKQVLADALNPSSQTLFQIFFDGPFKHGVKFRLKSVATGEFIKLDDGGGPGKLAFANSTNEGEWETFLLEFMFSGNPLQRTGPTFPPQSTKIRTALRTETVGTYATSDETGNLNSNSKVMDESRVFDIVDLNGGKLLPGDEVYLKAPNEKFLSYTLGNDDIAAKSAFPGAFEIFVVEAPATGTRTNLLGFKTMLKNRYLGRDGGSGNLRLTGDRLADWETFALESEDDDAGQPTSLFLNIKAAQSGQYVAAEGNGGGDINANRGTPSTWEKFEFMDLNAGYLESGDVVHIRTGNGHFFSATAQSHRLTATGTSGGHSEKFRVIKADGSTGPVRAGHRVFIQSLLTGKYLHAENGGGAGLNAGATNKDTFETFVLEQTPYITPTIVRAHLRTWQNRTYLEALNAGGGAMTSEAQTPNDGARFDIIDFNGGKLESGDRVYLRTTKGYFLTTESDDERLHAHAEMPSIQTVFVISKINGGTGPITNLNEVNLKSLDRDRFVTSEYGGSPIVFVNRTQPGPWENFFFLARYQTPFIDLGTLAIDARPRPEPIALPEGDLDRHYKLVLPARSRLVAHLALTGGNADLEILDKDFNILRSSRNTGTLSENADIVLEQGTYYIGVTKPDPNNTSLTYKLSVNVGAP